MEVRYDDADLQRLATDVDFHMPRYGRDLERSFRKAIGLLESSSSQSELRNFRGLRLELLKGDLKGLHSVRLNQQWRLIIEFRTNAQHQEMLVIKIVDYHR